MPADRTPAGYRMYGDGALARLEFIGAAKQLGLSLAEIGELLAVWESGACAEVKADLRPRLAARLAEARRRLTELTAFADSLRVAQDRLDALPDRAEPCDPACDLRAATPAPVACSLTGGELSDRTARWRTAVDGAERVEIPGGLRLTLPVERTAAVAALAVAEQRCCPFFDFRLHIDGPESHLDVRVPDGGAAMLADLFGGTAV